MHMLQITWRPQEPSSTWYAKNDDIWKSLGKVCKPKWKKKSNNLYCVGLFIHCNHCPFSCSVPDPNSHLFLFFQINRLTLNQNDWHWNLTMWTWNSKNRAMFGLRCYILFSVNDKNQLRRFNTLPTHFGIQSRISNRVQYTGKNSIYGRNVSSIRVTFDRSGSKPKALSDERVLFATEWEVTQ